MVTLHRLFCVVPYSSSSLKCLLFLSFYLRCKAPETSTLRLNWRIRYLRPENNTRVYYSVLYLFDEWEGAVDTGRRQGNQADQVTPSICLIYLPVEQPLYIIIPSTHRT